MIAVANINGVSELAKQIKRGVLILAIVKVRSPSLSLIKKKKNLERSDTEDNIKFIPHLSTL